MSKAIAMALFIIGAVTTNAYASDVENCPPVSAINSNAFTSDDPNIPPPHNKGFKYEASFKGKKWTGEALSTKDDFLAPKYELKAESFNGSICSYGGKKIVENGESSTPHLKLKSS